MTNTATEYDRHTVADLVGKRVRIKRYAKPSGASLDGIQPEAVHEGRVLEVRDGLIIMEGCEDAIWPEPQFSGVSEGVGWWLVTRITGRSPAMNRQPELLNAAADALDDGRDPLTTPFLTDHDVSLDECFDMAEWLAVGARLMAWCIENPGQAATALSGASDAMRMDTINRLLAKVNASQETPR